MGTFKSRRVKHVDGTYTGLYITSQSIKDHNELVKYYVKLRDNILEGIPLNIPKYSIERFNNIVLN